MFVCVYVCVFVCVCVCVYLGACHDSCGSCRLSGALENVIRVVEAAELALALIQPRLTSADEIMAQGDVHHKHAQNAPRCLRHSMFHYPAFPATFNNHRNPTHRALLIHATPPAPITIRPWPPKPYEFDMKISKRGEKGGWVFVKTRCAL